MMCIDEHMGLLTPSLFLPPHLQSTWFGYQIFLMAGLNLNRGSQYALRSSKYPVIAEALERAQNGSATSDT